MKKLITFFIFAAVFSFTVSSHTLDFEIPLKLEIAKTEKTVAKNYSGTDVLGIPLPFAGPFRVTYVFEIPESKWKFGAGASVYVYPFQAINASGSAIFEICNFKNGGGLELRNIVDVGIFMHFKEYYNVSKARRDVMASVSPLIEYSCMFYYRTPGKVPFFVGIGPVVSGACDQEVIKIYYGINVDLGWRFKF